MIVGTVQVDSSATFPLTGVYMVACGLLVLAGAMKAVRPGDTARAIVTLVPGRTPRLGAVQIAVRLGAGAEFCIGLYGLVWPNVVSTALVSGSYVFFTGVILLARRRGGVLSTCGCFGRPDTLPTALHLVLNGALLVSSAALAVEVALGHVGETKILTPFGYLAHQPQHGVALALVALVGLAVTYVAMAVAPSLTAVRTARAGAFGARP